MKTMQFDVYLTFSVKISLMSVLDSYNVYLDKEKETFRGGMDREGDRFWLRHYEQTYLWAQILNDCN